MVWFFKRKRDVEELKEDTRKAFEAVKKDMDDIKKWINHLNNQHKHHSNHIEELKLHLPSIKDEVEEIKEAISSFDESVFKQLSKQVFKKQTAVYGVQTGVQTAVQSAKLSPFLDMSNLSVTERAIVWVLLNSDLKLSYDDIAAILGKGRSTIRGQINSIKQKSEGLVEEFVEKNGKKRVYIPEQVKEKILKKAKVRGQKGKKKEESE